MCFMTIKVKLVISLFLRSKCLAEDIILEGHICKDRYLSPATAISRIGLKCVSTESYAGLN